MFSAFLDMNVLWPSLQRDFLLSLAADGLYRPLWSERILDELEEHEALKLVGRGAAIDDAVARTEHLMDRMRHSFEDALVTGWESLVGTFGLPDPDDEHVAAAAALGEAGVIVQTAAEFLTNTVSVDPARAAASLVAMTARYRNPPTAPTKCWLSSGSATTSPGSPY